MAELTREAIMLTAIFDAAVDAIVVADASGCTLRVNKSALELFEYTEAEVVGQNISLLMPEAFVQRHDEFMAHHLRTGEKRIIDTGRDVEGITKSGLHFPLHLSVGRAEIYGETIFIGIMHDLRNRRTAELALSRSQRLDAIGQMTGGIAHDFNNLLTVVIGNLELLQRHVDTEKAQAILHDALEAAELGAELTSRLMVFARNSMLNPEPCNINDVCESSLAILRRTLGSKYRIQTSFDAEVSQVAIDPTQFQTSIMNLVLNARDAMPNGGDLFIKTENVQVDDDTFPTGTDVASGPYVHLAISDTGEGMAPETQKRAFEPFYTTKPVGKGTGLGLSMVYGFVKQSRGQITLYSEPGHGTTIGMYFPAHDPATRAAPAPGKTATDTACATRTRTVLVVEDNLKVRSLSVARLQAMGFETLEAATADVALALLRQTPGIDILFSDVVMPGSMSGYELARIVRSEIPKIRILLTSGFSEEVVQQQQDEEAFAMISKPFRSIELKEKLQALLDDDLSETSSSSHASM